MIGIIAANNLRLSPYAFYYAKLLDEIGAEYEFIVPDRNPEMKDNYNYIINRLVWLHEKPSFVNYMLLSRQAKKISIRKYNFLIVLTTVNSVFCSTWLRKYFHKRYIIDIRDFTYEKNPLYFWIEKKVFKSALACVISSERFKLFLPKQKYLLCHNIGDKMEKNDNIFVKSSGKLVIGYVGAISYQEQCEMLMRLVACDNRFEFYFFGSGPSEKALRRVAEELDCTRVKFFGAYKQIQKKEILKSIDLLFNAYGNGYPLVDSALSNKLYDALYYRKPLLTSPNTYTDELGGPMAFPLDFSDSDILEKLWDWYHTLDNKSVDDYANSLYNHFIAENAKTSNVLKKYFMNIEYSKCSCSERQSHNE